MTKPTQLGSPEPDFQGLCPDLAASLFSVPSSCYTGVQTRFRIRAPEVGDFLQKQCAGRLFSPVVLLAQKREGNCSLQRAPDMKSCLPNLLLRPCLWLP